MELPHYGLWSTSHTWAQKFFRDSSKHKEEGGRNIKILGFIHYWNIHGTPPLWVMINISYMDTKKF